MSTGPGPVPEEPLGDRLYDAFVEQCLSGEAEDAASFLARHGHADADLLTRLRAVERLRTEAAPAAPPVPRPAGASLPFERLGPYRLLEGVSEGGMGTVYLAQHETMGLRVALKVIRAELTASETAIRRFEREAQAIARLRHPSIVTVHDAGTDRGVHWLAMEWVPGRPLDELAAQGPLDPDRVVGWGIALAHALHHAHERGIVHRDVKPSNVLVTPEDRPVLLDFGVAHLLDAEGTRLTQSFAGSPVYASPEQVSDPTAPLDGRTDVYGLGATLYEALTGRPPFVGSSVAQVLRQVLTEDPVPPTRLRPGLDPALDLVVTKALEKRPDARYADALSLARDLEAIRASRTIAARRPGARRRLVKWARRRPVVATVVGSLVAVLVGAAAWTWWRGVEAAADRRAEAARLVATALGRVDEFRQRRLRRAAEDLRLVHLRDQVMSSYMPEEAVKEYHALAAARADRRLTEERLFQEVLDAVERAERLDGAVARVEEVRARLYFERLEDARAMRDREMAQVYEDLVLRHDPEGRHVADLRRPGGLRVTTLPAGAEVHLLRFEEAHRLDPSADRRHVPVPRRGRLPAPPGAWALRVVRGAGATRPGDVILRLRGRAVARGIFALADLPPVRRGDRLRTLDGRSIEASADLLGWTRSEGDAALVFEDAAGGEVSVETNARTLPLGDVQRLAETGGVPADVHRDGAVVEEILPQGLVVRWTAAPRFLGPDTREGSSPVAIDPLDPGAYVLVLRAAGHEEALVPLTVVPGGVGDLVVPLLPEGSTPDGFVRVTGRRGPERSFWIQEREVTCGEYLPFLQDPATLRAIAESRHPVRYPRDDTDEGRGGLWRTEGGWDLPAGFDPDYPVLGVSWEDAVAYAAWRSARDGRRYGLPTREEFVIAGGSDTERAYAFGNVFSPGWAKTCFARPKAYPEPSMSYPTDESPYGAYDLTGSAAEWLDDWYDESRGLRRLGGQGWGQAHPEGFGLWAGFGMGPTRSHYEAGFRLVLRSDAAPEVTDTAQRGAR